VLVALSVFAVIVCFVAVQTAAALSDHSDHEGPNDHCCAACHGGHYPVLQTQAVVFTARLIMSGWHSWHEEELPLAREWSAVNSSRAPPV
jgi:hypothetical protein